MCANRIIWDARELKELKIRHTSGGPQRFIQQAAPALAAMSEASDQPVVETIRAAKNTRIAAKVADVEKWLTDRGFARAQAEKAVSLAQSGGDSGSSGDPTNLWDIVQGGTAAARQIKHTDTRLGVERKFSALLGSRS